MPRRGAGRSVQPQHCSRQGFEPQALELWARPEVRRFEVKLSTVRVKVKKRPASARRASQGGERYGNGCPPRPGATGADPTLLVSHSLAPLRASAFSLLVGGARVTIDPTIGGPRFFRRRDGPGPEAARTRRKASAPRIGEPNSFPRCPAVCSARPEMPPRGLPQRPAEYTESQTTNRNHPVGAPRDTTGPTRQPGRPCSPSRALSSGYLGGRQPCKSRKRSAS
jgi:hypothetical protein